MAETARVPKRTEMPITESRSRIDETVTKAKKSRLPRNNKMAIVAKMALADNGQNDQKGQKRQIVYIGQNEQKFPTAQNG